MLCCGIPFEIHISAGINIPPDLAQLPAIADRVPGRILAVDYLIE